MTDTQKRKQRKKPRPPDTADGHLFTGKERGSTEYGKKSSVREKKISHKKGIHRKKIFKKKNSSKSVRNQLRDSIGKVCAACKEKLRMMDLKRLFISNIPYLVIFYLVEKEAWLYRHCTGSSMIQKLMNLLLYFTLAFQDPLPSLYLWDLAIGIAGAAGFKAFIWYRMKNAKKFRQGEEYGSARWGTPKDIAPFIDPVFENNIILTATEFLTMNSRPKNWKVARNKNVIVIGGSGSGKTRNVIKPNLMQMGEKISYVLTDPNGTTF